MNIELPRDAEGREIPLDTKVLYDTRGTKRNVRAFMRLVDDGRWRVFFLDFNGSSSPDKMRLTPPDSLKQLAEDLNRVTNFKGDGDFASPACAYMGIAADSCDDCKFRYLNGTCSLLALKDIASRVNRLCSDAE